VPKPLQARGPPDQARKSELVRGNFESVVGEFYGFNFTLLFDEDIVYAIALFTDKMLMPFNERVEMLQASEYQHLELFVNDEFLQISIDGSQANIGKLLSDPVINLIRRGMGAVVLNSIPDNFQLFGLS